jgi:hypothetical protein
MIVVAGSGHGAEVVGSVDRADTMSFLASVAPSRP